MTYKELYEKAASMLDRGEITLGDFNKMVKPLDVEICHEPHWIPVAEKLPVEEGRYLVCGKKGGIYHANYRGKMVDASRVWWKISSVSRGMDALARTLQGGDGMKCFYFGYQIAEEIGLTFAILYIPRERGIQISMMIGCLMLAVGYDGRRDE